MAELGILGINIPVRYGGQGFDYVALVSFVVWFFIPATFVR